MKLKHLTDPNTNITITMFTLKHLHNPTKHITQTKRNVLLDNSQLPTKGWPESLSNDINISQLTDNTKEITPNTCLPNRNILFDNPLTSKISNVITTCDTHISQLTNNIKDKISDTTDIPLNQMLYIIKVTEEKIRNQNLNNVDVTASLNVGIVTLTITKKISIE